MTPLEIARKRQQESNSVYTCHDCKNCVKVGGWWYCEDSGKMLHPMMLERVTPLNCERAVPKGGLNMDNKINSTTLEEIKARIDYCRNVKTAGDCMSCPYGEDADVCASDFMFDSFDYMQYLESELAEARKDVDVLGEQVAALDGAYNAVKRERDAAVEDLRKGNRCPDCAHYYEPVMLKIAACSKCFCGANWQWRGVEVAAHEKS